ncbi:MAG: two-component system phosphate regulon sensor histidine kinase PhoR [Cellvibrionaceae bacterium]
MNYYGVSSEIRRLVSLSILCLIIGLLLGHVEITLAVGTLLYVTYHLRNLRRLLKCLQGRRLAHIPEASGLWGQVFDHLSRLKRREIREKNKLKAVISRVGATTAALNDAVILLDKNNNLHWWNKATERVLDLKKGDSGSSIINFIRNPKFVSYLESNDYSIALTLPSPRSIELQLEFQITRFGQGEALIVVRDITRIYKLEQMRKDFVANVSHELRTPLTVIRGYLETLEDSRDPSLESSPHWQKAMSQMQQQAARMTTLINDLTMLSKLETDRIGKDQESTVALKPLLEMICSEAQAISGEKRHAIKLECDAYLALLGNDRELHSAFSNLITNAIKYSLPEKTITVTVTINLAGRLVVKVKDEGLGIEQEHISRLTERFYRVDSSRTIQTGGTGLGLAIVKHILLRHDARLQIDSIYNQGSTFACIFPDSRLINI